MFAREHKQEYDPTSSPMIERPLASGRPLGVQVHGNAHGGRGLDGLRSENASPTKNTYSSIPINSPATAKSMLETSSSPLKGQQSPTKSSLSSRSRYAQAHQAFDPENGIWSDEEESSDKQELPPGKSLHRHAKSVTFDVAPPQINEYEMTTPDPSSVASGSREGSYDSVDDEEESFDRGSSIDRDDSFDASLEDTEKTPVVLPEDWRFMSPAVANDDLAAHVENPFDGEERSSPAPTARASSALDARPSPLRIDSADSNGEPRPLPPLPALGAPMFPRARSDSNGSLSNTVDRISSAQHSAHSPPRPASITKAELQGMGGCSMPIEDRLRLMMLQDVEKPQTVAEEHNEQRERRLRRASPARGPEPSVNTEEVSVHEEEVEDDDVADLGDYKLPPRISRESILRKVKSRNLKETEDEATSMAFDGPPDADRFSMLDPDVPIPSRETDVVDPEVVIKQEPSDDESEVDVYSIPDLYSQQLEAESYMNAIEKLEAFQKASATEQRDEDEESHYSVDSKEYSQEKPHLTVSKEDEGPPTPRALTLNIAPRDLERKESKRMSLPQFAALLGDSDFGFGMESFITPSPPVDQEPEKSVLPSKPSWSPSPSMAQISTHSVALSEPRVSDQYLGRPVTPEQQLQPPRFPGQRECSDDEPGTPDSVIRHPVAESPVPDSPGIPAPVATIKAPGGRLKTRPSVTPADIEAMAEVRRQVSNGSQVPAVPKIPERHLSRPSVVGEVEEPELDNEMVGEDTLTKNQESDMPKRGQRKSSLLPLEVPVDDTERLGFGIESEFDRVIEAQKVAFNFLSPLVAAQANTSPPGHAEYLAGQAFMPMNQSYANKAFRTQKGYLMRQNTKVIIASSASHESTESAEIPNETKENHGSTARATRSAGNSPRKPSASQPWTAEPWNGKIRRKSLRKSGGIPSKAPSSGPVPPLPGQQSNVASALDSVTEDQTLETTEEIGEDGERGRLFVKVVRVKDLDLPLPRGEPIVAYFKILIDCI